jgi:thymidylate synthase ThyX
MPPEKSAYALARYSRSADSIRQSIDWVRAHNSQNFLESFYFQYGHQSIADLGHTVLCFEGISELAASEIEDETLWDGQAKSSRYQDFSKADFITPPELEGDAAALYRGAGECLLRAYQDVHARVRDYLTDKLPRPESMKPDAYARNIAARAFDVARYLLFWGVPTNVGQVTSIRTLEKQIKRMRASEFGEVRALGEEMAEACAASPDCVWNAENNEPLAPTLARHAEPDLYARQAREDLKLWAAQNLSVGGREPMHDVELIKPDNVMCEIVATLLYPACEHPFRAIYETVREWSQARRVEVLEVAVKSRGRRDELLREFRGGQYCFDMLIDIGAYRDMHRHRRCHQYRQAYKAYGYPEPGLLAEAGAAEIYGSAMRNALMTMQQLPEPARQYLLPFGARSRFLFKMDFAEVEYISRVRSGVKGHFSYREIAWQMKMRVEEIEPELAKLIDATPPWVEDPLTR